MGPTRNAAENPEICADGACRVPRRNLSTGVLSRPTATRAKNRLVGRTPTRRQISLAHLTLLDASPPELVRAAARAGFDAVGIRLGRGSLASDPTWPMLGDTGMRRETQRVLDDSGLRVMEVEGVSILPDRTIDAFRQLPDLLESAAALGAQFVTVASFDADAAHTACELARLCEMCAPYQLQPVVEFMARSGVPSIQAAMRLVSAPGYERASVLLDVLHFARSGGTVGELEGIDRDRIGLVQLCDAPLLAPDEEAARRAESRSRLLPGEGALPLVGILDRLPAQVPISVEAPSDCYARCTAEERARLAMQATHAVLRRRRRR